MPSYSRLLKACPAGFWISPKDGDSSASPGNLVGPSHHNKKCFFICALCCAGVTNWDLRPCPWMQMWQKQLVLVLLVVILQCNRIARLAEWKIGFIADISLIKYIQGDLEGLLSQRLWRSKASLEPATVRITCLGTEKGAAPLQLPPVVIWHCRTHPDVALEAHCFLHWPIIIKILIIAYWAFVLFGVLFRKLTFKL